MQLIWIALCIVLSATMFGTQDQDLKKVSEVTLFQWAKLGRLDKIKTLESTLKKQGVKLVWNNTNEDGETPLLVAARNGQKDVVAYLLEKIDSNLQEGVKLQLLEAAIKNNKDNIVKYILDLGVSPQTKAIAQGLAQKKGYPLVLYLFLNHPDAYTGETPLTAAIKANDSKAVAELIQQGVSVHEPNKADKKPLLVAIQGYPKAINNGNQEEIIRLLIKQGANVAFKEAKTEKTPLHYAIELEIPDDLIKELIHCNSTLNNVDRDGNTPLHYAAQYANEAVVVELCNQHADITIQNKKGKKSNQVIGDKTKLKGQAKTNSVHAIQATLSGYEQHPVTTPRQSQCLYRRGSQVKTQNDAQTKQASDGTVSSTGSVSTVASAPSTQQKSNPTTKKMLEKLEASETSRAKESASRIPRASLSITEKTATKPAQITFDHETGDTHIEIPMDVEDAEQEASTNK